MAATASDFSRSEQLSKPSGSTRPVSLRLPRIGFRLSSAGNSRSGRLPSLQGTSTTASAPQARA